MNAEKKLSCLQPSPARFHNARTQIGRWLPAHGELARLTVIAYQCCNWRYIYVYISCMVWVLSKSNTKVHFYYPIAKEVKTSSLNLITLVCNPVGIGCPPRGEATICFLLWSSASAHLLDFVCLSVYTPLIIEPWTFIAKWVRSFTEIRVFRVFEETAGEKLNSQDLSVWWGSWLKEKASGSLSGACGFLPAFGWSLSDLRCSAACWGGGL